jgi:hypothetical protein
VIQKCINNKKEWQYDKNVKNNYKRTLKNAWGRRQPTPNMLPKCNNYNKVKKVGAYGRIMACGLLMIWDR